MAVTKNTRASRRRSPSTTKRSLRPARRLPDVCLRLHGLRDEGELRAILVTTAADLLGARPVLLVLETPDGFAATDSRLPPDEQAQPLLDAVFPWLEEARRTRASSLHHGPPDAD